MAGFNEYELYITNMTLPRLETAWTEVELGTSVFRFRRNLKTSKVFEISGFISRNTMENTEEYARSLNNALNDNPSGVLVDGYGNTYNCYVMSWEITPVSGQNRFNFSMNLRLIEET